MEATLAARIGGAEKGASLIDPETGALFELMPIWHPDTRADNDPRSRAVTGYRLRINRRFKDPEEKDLTVTEIGKFLDTYPSLWTPNIKLQGEIKYFQLQRTGGQTSFILRLQHPYVSARVIYSDGSGMDSEMSVETSNSLYDVIEVPWRQYLYASLCTFIQVFILGGRGSSEHFIAGATLTFVPDACDKEHQYRNRIVPTLVNCSPELQLTIIPA